MAVSKTVASTTNRVSVCRDTFSTPESRAEEAIMEAKARVARARAEYRWLSRKIDERYDAQLASIEADLVDATASLRRAA